ncbi:PAS domain S-box-containing protein [Maledivibacter halophilus]|uniref:PAS domain S-box-containing protein n=2 Tax=Maledivibacter halophilus TaxID=36842 RepID=A0A1T5IDW5_9FIRM|nr:PAS domain S-box-containing protein [Maledivibacter halophilus]
MLMIKLLKNFLNENTKLTKKHHEVNKSFKEIISFFNIITSTILEEDMMILFMDSEMIIRSVFLYEGKGLKVLENKTLNIDDKLIEEKVFIKTYKGNSIYCYISKEFTEKYNNCKYRFAIISLKSDNRKYKKFIEKINYSILNLLTYDNEKYSSYENLLMYLDAIDDGISACDSNGILRYINESACKIIGAKKEEMINKKLDLLTNNAILSQVIKTGKTYMDFEYFLEYNKKTFHLMNSAYPVYAKNKNIIGGIDIFRRIKRSMKVASDLAGYEAVYRFENFIGKSKVFNDSKELAKKFARNDKNILILGESGTGKELFAQAIHNYSHRSNGPFVAINCASFPKDLFDSELFGYDEGAFTGARKGGKLGKFELASGGTLFLDEIGEMPIHLQAKLLRVLETKSISRIGSNKKIDVNIRIIAATNRNLEKMVNNNNFRGDLYYRLKVLYLILPPLVKRGKDIIELTNYFIDKYSKDSDRKVKGMDKEAEKLLLSYDWPGNIRELENIIALSLFICDGEYINKEHLVKAGLKDKNKYSTETINPSKKLSDINRELIIKTLEKTKGNKKRAAEILGVSRNTIYRTLKKNNS